MEVILLGQNVKPGRINGTYTIFLLGLCPFTEMKFQATIFVGKCTGEEKLLMKVSFILLMKSINII